MLVIIPILDQIILNSVDFGESLKTCVDLQNQFENRPVTKYIFPLIDEMQATVCGMQTKTLQTYDPLGQIMFLDVANQLN